jgi:two-component system sensor histidine kinase YesM
MNILQFLDTKRTIHSKIFRSFIILIAISTGVVAFGSYYVSVNFLTSEVDKSFSESVFLLKNSVENELYQIKQISSYIYIDQDIKDAITEYNTNDEKSKQAEQLVQDKLNNYLISTTFNYINVIKIYGFNGYQMAFGKVNEILNVDDSQIINSDGYKEALKNSDISVCRGLSKSMLKEQSASPEYSFSIFRVIKDRSYKHNIGVVYINIDPEIFFSLSENLNPEYKNEIYILDNQNNFVNTYNPVVSVADTLNILKEAPAESIKDPVIINDNKSSNRVYCYSINDFGWKVLGFLPINELTQNNKSIFLITTVTLIFSFLLATVIWYFISSNITKPIKNLTDATKTVRRGNFDVQVNYSYDDEIGILTNNFNYMVKKIKILINEVLEETERKKDAEYKALQAQINPHFLYNTLNSIRWMAIIQKSDNIKNVVEALGKLLKDSTNNIEKLITVEEELENLNDYILIQKIAYMNKFEVNFYVDQDVLKLKCLKFILQPLVENAIFHGILPKEYYGTIWVSIQRHDGFLRISVKDDGIGMEDKEIRKILVEGRDIVKKFNGIGIKNIYERIQLTYGDKASFTIESEIGQYTNMIIVIPVIEELDEGGNSGV